MKVQELNFGRPILNKTFSASSCTINCFAKKFRAITNKYEKVLKLCLMLKYSEASLRPLEIWMSALLPHKMRGNALQH